MRPLSLLLALPLLVACGKVSDSEPSLAAGTGSEPPRGGAAPDPVRGAGTGGMGGSQPVAETDAGRAQPDASTTPPRPAADGGAKDEDAGSDSVDALCDGSDAMRLVYASEGGGPLFPTFGFTNPHGHAFLAIDGKCRYYAGNNFMRGVISGTLTPARAEQLSTDLHWNDLDSWGAYGVNKDAACPDAGTVSLMKAKAAAGCSCGCDPAAPKGLGDAIQRAYQAAMMLMTEGKPLDGPVSAVLVQSAYVGTVPMQPEFEWPLARAVESIPNLIVDPSDEKLWKGTGPWATFDDPAEVAKLREMRTATVSADSRTGYMSQMVLLRVDGMESNLFIRDELPAGVEKAWAELAASVPSK